MVVQLVDYDRVGHIAVFVVEKFPLAQKLPPKAFADVLELLLNFAVTNGL